MENPQIILRGGPKIQKSRVRGSLTPPPPVRCPYMYTYIYQGFHSNHAQIARLNSPTLLQCCQTMSCMFVWAWQGPLAH